MSELNSAPEDVWLLLDENEDVKCEANTFRLVDGTYRIEWYHVDVGLVSSVEFNTYPEAVAWYEANGYRNFASN